MLNENNCLVAVSCRTASSRLPAKALLPLGNQPSIVFLLKRLRKLTHVVLATTDLPSDDLLVKIVSSEGFKVRRGPCNNVFERLRVIAIELDLPYLVRITADCPLLGGDFVLDAINIANNDLLLGFNWDLATTKGFNSPGIDLEIIKVEAMNRISNSLDFEEQEHVTLGFIRRQEEYIVRPIAMPRYNNENGRYLLDTFEDYLFLSDKIQADDSDKSTLEILSRYQ